MAGSGSVTPLAWGRQPSDGGAAIGHRNCDAGTEPIRGLGSGDIVVVGFSDEDKSTAFIRKALSAALICPLCEGLLDPQKSVSFDHKQRVREGGKGTAENCDLVHPYCNSSKN